MVDHYRPVTMWCLDARSVIRWRPRKKGDGIGGIFLGQVMVRSGDEVEILFALKQTDGRIVVFSDDPAADPEPQ